MTDVIGSDHRHHRPHGKADAIDRTKEIGISNTNGPASNLRGPKRQADGDLRPGGQKRNALSVRGSKPENVED